MSSGTDKWTIFSYHITKDDLWIIQTARSILFPGETDQLKTDADVLNRLACDRRETRSGLQIDLLCKPREDSLCIVDYELDPERFIQTRHVTWTQVTKYKKNSQNFILPLVPAEQLIPRKHIEKELGEFSEDEIIEDCQQAYQDIQRQKSELKGITEATAEAQIILDKAEEKEAEIALLVQQQEAERRTLANWVRQKQRLEETYAELAERQSQLEDETALINSMTHGAMSTATMKASIEPPIWTVRANQTQRQSTIQYIRELKCFKDLKLMSDDRQLIFASLAKSGKMAIFEELSDDERGNLSKFCEYIERVYGGSADEVREELAQARQGASETYPSFFRRIAGLYLRAKGGSEATLPELSTITDVSKQQDIKWSFLRGLRSQ